MTTLQMGKGKTIIRSLARFVIARSQRVARNARPMTGSATKQSILSFRGAMDCFAEFIIGRRFAPTRWLAMTGIQANTSGLERHP
jgi:hypothetical protein